jgi:hypothetical protein
MFSGIYDPIEGKGIDDHAGKAKDERKSRGDMLLIKCRKGLQDSGNALGGSYFVRAVSSMYTYGSVCCPDE